MELVTILRRLWLRRYIVAAGLAVSLVAGLMAVYHVPSFRSKQTHVGLAAARILVDTPHSQVVDVNPLGIDGIGTRANLLANLMTSAQVRALIAKDAGINPGDLAAVAPSDGAPPVPTLLSEDATKHSTPSSAYKLNVYSGTLPIIQLQAEAPNAEQAARLANASVVALGSYLRSVATAQNIPPRKQIVVSGMGSAQASEVTHGPRKLIGLVVAIVIFSVFCASILIVEGIARGWRRAATFEAA
jgi:hypothetical protein